MQQVTSQDTSDAVLAALVGDDCSWCATGALAREEFKGDAAVVCEECGTPAARVW
ncbi:HVO_A0556 family zinc finger protein [Halorussus salinus]|uniref:HVO_A0556 family zinc finger protein n=1 Tax=Halorussus salinus TaxID=1364935 RepID=UPI00192F73E8|nr:HVO_A0556 family zinc finger protein [Halorussus salinus]